MNETNPFQGVPCRNCGQETLRLEWRDRLIAKPLGSHSLAGAQMKTSALEVSWPWCVCDTCGAESEGKPTTTDDVPGDVVEEHRAAADDCHPPPIP